MRNLLRLCVITCAISSLGVAAHGATAEAWNALCPENIRGGPQYSCLSQVPAKGYHFLSGDGYAVVYSGSGGSAVCSAVESNETPSLLECAPKLSSGLVNVEQRDINGDGVPEIVVSGPAGGSSPQASASMFYQLSGDEFVNIGPVDTSDDVITSEVDDYVLVDLDGDGVAEIVAYPIYDYGDNDSKELLLGPKVYSLHEGKYVETASPAWVSTVFERETSKPKGVSETPGVAAGQYSLIAVPGSIDPKAVPSSATVSVDGTVVITPGEIKHHQWPVTKPVTLKAGSTISVEMNGGPGDKLLLLLEPVSAK